MLVQWLSIQWQLQRQIKPWSDEIEVCTGWRYVVFRYVLALFSRTHLRTHLRTHASSHVFSHAPSHTSSHARTHELSACRSRQILIASSYYTVVVTNLHKASLTQNVTRCHCHSPSHAAATTCAGVAPYTKWSDQSSDPKHGNACFKPGGFKGGGDWSCPKGCKKVGRVPWCGEAKHDTTPCRVAKTVAVAGDLPAA